MVWGCLIVGLILFLIARFSVKGKGEYGEDRIYDILQKVDGYKATLPNCYLPKGNGETAEVDLIFLHESGIYVFVLTTLIISKKPGNTGISRDIRTEFTTDLLLSD